MATKILRLLVIGQDWENFIDYLACGKLILDRNYEPTEEYIFRERISIDGEVFLIELLYGVNPDAPEILRAFTDIDGIIVPFRITDRTKFDVARQQREEAAKVLEIEKPMPTIVVAIDIRYAVPGERQVSDEEGREFAARFNARYVDWNPGVDDPDAPHALLREFARDRCGAQGASDTDTGDKRKIHRFSSQRGERARLLKKSRPPLAPTHAGVDKPRDRSSRFSITGWKRGKPSAPPYRQKDQRGSLEKLKHVLCFGFREEPKLYKPLPAAPPRVDMSKEEWTRLYGSFPTFSPMKGEK